MHTDQLTVAALGELHEPAGILHLRRVENLGAFDAKRKRYKVVVAHHVQQIEVLPRSGDFGQLVERVAEKHDNVMNKRSRRVVLVDVTSAGRAILEPIRAAGIKCTPVAVTSSIGAKATWGAVQVGEVELAARIAIVLAEDRLRVDPALDHSQDLAAQLERFTTGKPVKSVAPQPVARQELVRALSIALWWGDRLMTPRIEQPLAPSGIDYEALCRPPTFDEALAAYGRRPT